MADITAKMVKALREKTDLPMMECKQALKECDGDESAAVEFLRQKYKNKMADRSGRATGEGRITVYIDDSGQTGSIVEIQCETTPVASNELFLDLGVAVAKKVAEGAEESPSIDSIKGDPALDAAFTDVYGKLRETMNLIRVRKVCGAALTSYVHHDGKSGVLIALNGKPTTDELGPDLCMHATFNKPIAIDADGVPADQIEKVRKEASDEAREQGKPEPIIEKITEGKVNAYLSQHVLVEQLHARSDRYGKKKVKDVLKEGGVSGVSAMVFMSVGEQA